MIDQYRKTLNKLVVQYEQSVRTVTIEKAALEKAEKEAADAEEAQRHIQAIAEQVQRVAHERLASVVTRCLTAVLDNPYDFEIIFEKKRGRTEAGLVLKRGENVLENPIEEAGGGVMDVSGFATRVANLMMAKPGLRKVLFLDEPFRNLNPPEKYGPRVEQLIMTLARDLGIQFVIVTNRKDFHFGKVIQL